MKKIKLNINIGMCIDIITIGVFIIMAMFNIFFNQEKVPPTLVGILQLVIASFFFLNMLLRKLEKQSQKLIEEMYNSLQQSLEDRAILLEVIQRLSLQIRSNKKNGMVN